MAAGKTNPTDSEPVDNRVENRVENSVDLDPISLEQALLDVDVANARVIDLTKRLTALTKELRATTTSLQKSKLHSRQIQRELDEIKRSRAFRSATTAQRVLGSVRSRVGR